MLYKNLRKHLLDKEILHKDAARLIGMPNPTFASRMQGKYPWDMAQVYALCKLLDIPLSDIAEYFPARDTPQKASE